MALLFTGMVGSAGPWNPVLFPNSGGVMLLTGGGMGASGDALPISLGLGWSFCMGGTTDV